MADQSSVIMNSLGLYDNSSYMTSTADPAPATAGQNTAEQDAQDAAGVWALGGTDGGMPAADAPYHLIAVMGMTGAGKSTFIQKATGSDRIGVGHQLESETEAPQGWTFEHEGREIVLIDTPGFEDTIRTDADVLGLVAEYLSLTYSRGYHLSGIIYLHDVTKNRMTHGGKANLAMFRALCGTGSLTNVVLATTRWGILNDEAKQLAEGFEKQLSTKAEYWSEMKDLGSSITRFTNTSKSALAIIDQIIAKDSKITLQIQSELVDQRVPFANTAAAGALNAELLQMQQGLEAKIEKFKIDIEQQQNQVIRDFKQKEKRKTEKILADYRTMREKLQADRSDLLRQHDMKLRQLEKLQKEHETQEVMKLETETSDLRNAEVAASAAHDARELARLTGEIQRKEVLKRRRKRWIMFLSAAATTGAAAGLSSSTRWRSR